MTEIWPIYWSLVALKGRNAVFGPLHDYDIGFFVSCSAIQTLNYSYELPRCEYELYKKSLLFLHVCIKIISVKHSALSLFCFQNLVLCAATDQHRYYFYLCVTRCKSFSIKCIFNVFYFVNVFFIFKVTNIYAI